MPRLSLCMIARDEERFIGAALASARECVSELIVVDTGSRDRTAAIAAEHGARVLEFAWCDDFSAARNRGLAAASGTHILVLDADERLREELGKAQRNTRLLELALADDPADGDLAGYLAVEYTRANRWQEAEALALRTLPLFYAALDALPKDALKLSPIPLAGALATAQLRRGAPAEALATVNAPGHA